MGTYSGKQLSKLELGKAKIILEWKQPLPPLSAKRDDKVTDDGK